MGDVFICDAVRTPIGRFGGSLAKIPATDLGAIVIREALLRAKVDPAQVSEVIMGQVLAAGAGVGDRDAVGAGERVAPAGSWVL